MSESWKLAIRVPAASLAEGGLMILSAVASPQDRLGDQRKEYARETIGVKTSTEDYENFMARLGEKYPER